MMMMSSSKNKFSFSLALTTAIRVAFSPFNRMLNNQEDSI